MERSVSHYHKRMHTLYSPYIRFSPNHSMVAISFPYCFLKSFAGTDNHLSASSVLSADRTGFYFRFHVTGKKINTIFPVHLCEQWCNRIRHRHKQRLHILCLHTNHTCYTNQYTYQFFILSSFIKRPKIHIFSPICQPYKIFSTFVQLITN